MKTTKRLLYSFLAITSNSGAVTVGHRSGDPVEHHSALRGRLTLHVFGLELLPAERHHAAILVVAVPLAATVTVFGGRRHRSVRGGIAFVAGVTTVRTTGDGGLVQQGHDFVDGF